MDCPPDGPLIGHRIADGRHPVFDGSGASRYGARWHSPGTPVIYAAGTYAGAMLEVLAHAGIGCVPKHTQWIEIGIPAEVSRACVDIDALPEWDAEDGLASRIFGDAWLCQQRTAVLIVPSVVARKEHNLLINPAHPDFRMITATAPSPVLWDRRRSAAPERG